MDLLKIQSERFTILELGLEKFRLISRSINLFEGILSQFFILNLNEKLWALK